MRIFLVILLSLLLIPLLLGTTVIGIANAVLTEDFIKTTLDEIDLYGQLEEMLPGILEEQLGGNGEPPPGEVNPMEVLLPRLNLTPIVREAADGIIGQVFSFLNKDTDEIILTMDTSGIMEQIEAIIMDREQLTDLMREIEPDIVPQLEQASDAEFSDFQQEVLNDFRQEADIPESVEVNLLEQLSEENPELLDTLETVRTVYGYMRLALWISLGACGVVFLLMLLCSFVGGLVASAICMLLIGVPLSAATIGITMSFGRIVDIIGAEIPADMLGIVEGLVTQVVSVPRNIGLGLGGVAIVFIILAIIVGSIKSSRRRKRQQREAAEAEAAEPTPTEPAEQAEETEEQPPQQETEEPTQEETAEETLEEETTEETPEDEKPK